MQEIVYAYTNVSVFLMHWYVWEGGLETVTIPLIPLGFMIIYQ